jgi:hypothetical protein
VGTVRLPADQRARSTELHAPVPGIPFRPCELRSRRVRAIRLFFGIGSNQADSLSFDLVSDEMDGRAIDEDGSYRGLYRRYHDSLLRAMFDNSVSRVYLGVHWRFDGLSETVQNHNDILTDASKLGGVPLGRTLAQNIFSNGMVRSNAPRASITPAMLTPVP